MRFTVGPKEVAMSMLWPRSRKMSSCRYRCRRSAPVSSRPVAASTPPTVIPGSRRSRSGTTLATMPPERRSVAVVRPETGRPRVTSRASVMAPRYAAKAATTIGAILLDSSAAVRSSNSTVAEGNSAETRIGCAAEPPVRPANVTGSASPARWSCQYSRSARIRVESR
ncbi:hypothetical protein KP696_31420 [Nocardia seriolae]|nr:hypothetical protein NS14008_20665 [Nocardia seriolae]